MLRMQMPLKLLPLTSIKFLRLTPPMQKSKYLNKVVAVSGEVKQVSLNQQHQQIILLKTNDPGRVG